MEEPKFKIGDIVQVGYSRAGVIYRMISYESGNYIARSIRATVGPCDNHGTANHFTYCTEIDTEDAVYLTAAEILRIKARGK